MNDRAARRGLAVVASAVALAAGLLSGCVIIPGESIAGRETAREATTGSTAARVAGLGVSREPHAETSLPGVRDSAGEGKRFTATELQTELLAFVDRYLEAVAEAADWGADHAETLKARAAFRQTKVVYVTAAITSATEPDPLRVLRDLLVLLRLQNIVWAGGGHAWAGPEATARMVRALSTLERQLVKLATLVLTQEDIDIVHQLTERWHAANPERRYVAFVRFHDLEDSELKRRFESHLEQIGLLAPVTKATEEIQEMRQLAERGLFLANHMPMLVEWQAEAYLYNALKVPELQSLVGDMDRFAGTAEDFTAQMAGLPDRIATERAAAMRDLAALVQRERREALDQFIAELRAERVALVADVHSSAGELLPLAQHLDAAAGGLRDTLKLVADLQANSGGEDFDLASLDTSVHSMIELTHSASGTVQSLRELLAGSADAAQALERLDGLLYEHERRLFLYAALLVLLAGGLACVAAVLLRRRTVA